jgi:hypothetical protein
MITTTIISGKNHHDKSNLALSMCYKQGFAYISPKNIKGNCFNALKFYPATIFGRNPENFTIIIDEINCIEKIKHIATLTKISFRPKYSKQLIEIDRPQIIMLTKINFKGQINTNRYLIIDLYKKK